jgi:hypothetical protein
MNLRPYDRHFFIPYGAVKTTGGSLSLAKGQLGLFGITDATPEGLEAYGDLKGVSKTKGFVIQSGSGKEGFSRSSNDKNYSTPEFNLSEVVGLSVTAPNKTEQGVDEVVLGYNGIEDSTAISVSKGAYIPISLKLTGKALSYFGYNGGVLLLNDVIEVPPCPPTNPALAPCDGCDPCAAVSCVEPVLEAIERLKKKRLLGLHTLEEVIDITPVHSCSETVTETDVKTFCLEVCDTGDDAALSALKVQYPALKIGRTDRKGSVSKYQAVTDTVPADYEQKLGSILKGCDSCPASWTEVAGGYAYAVSVEDEGADESSTVESIAHAVAGTGKKAEGQFAGVGLYTVVTDAKLTKAEIAAFVTANPTATVTYLDKVSTICTNSTVTTVSWSACGVCKQTTKTFIIDVPDDDCGNDRLAELQAYYPELTIALEGTTGGCQTRYTTDVVTNVVCDECDDIYKDIYTADAPRPFGEFKWQPEVTTASATNCKCGIRFKAKQLVIDAGECLIDRLDYIEDSVRIQVSAGYMETLPTENYPSYDNPVAVTYLSRWSPRSHVAGNMRVYEQMAHVYFTGEARHKKPLARKLLNEESVLQEGEDQVVDYELTIRPKRYKALSDQTVDTISFHVITYYGYHEAVEALLNNIAAAAGVEPVRLTA